MFGLAPQAASAIDMRPTAIWCCHRRSSTAPGLLPELVKTRYGFHIVAVDERIPGKTLPFDIVCNRIAEQLNAMVEEKALRQYISILAGNADIRGADLNATAVPLVQ